MTHREPDPIDPRACSKCRSSVHVDDTLPAEQAKTRFALYCVPCRRYFAKVAES